MTSRHLRSAVRALILDDDERVLLGRHEVGRGPFWTLPGGGVSPGETFHQALRRELAEETGFVADSIEGPIWYRTSLFDDNPRYRGNRNRAFLVRVSNLHFAPTMSRADREAEGLYEFIWWTLDDLRSTDAVVYPPNLAAIVRSIVDDGVPPAPFELSD